MDKDSIHIRLKKVMGQVMAVDRMIDEEKSAEMVLVQLNAASSALIKVGQMVLESSIGDELDRLGAESGDKERCITEIRRFLAMN